MGAFGGLISDFSFNKLYWHDCGSQYCQSIQDHRTRIFKKKKKKKKKKNKKNTKKNKQNNTKYITLQVRTRSGSADPCGGNHVRCCYAACLFSVAGIHISYCIQQCQFFLPVNGVIFLGLIVWESLGLYV